MKPGTTALHVDLVGVAARILANDPETALLLRVCYGAALSSAGSSAHPLHALLRLDRAGWTVRVEGRSRRREPDRTLAIRALNHELLHAVMLRAPRYFYVHAGVVALGDGAVILPGLSGAGKSTLVLALLQAGARFLSDELLVYDAASNRILPFPRAIKIRDVCAGWFEPLAARFVGEGEGRFLRLDSVPAGIAAAASPHAIVAPRWKGDEADRLVAVSRGSALLDLTASALNFGTHRDESLDHLASLVRRVSAWRLTWRDPHRAAALVLDALGRKGS